jgi:hypothetical protein
MMSGTGVSGIVCCDIRTAWRARDLGRLPESVRRPDQEDGASCDILVTLRLQPLVDLRYLVRIADQVANDFRSLT